MRGRASDLDGDELPVLIEVHPPHAQLLQDSAMSRPPDREVSVALDRREKESDGSQLVITYNAVPRYGQTSNTSMTFQIILRPSGEIIYQYNDLTGTVTSTTIGWQNQDKDVGACIVYNGNPSGLPKEEYLQFKTTSSFRERPVRAHVSLC